MADTIQVDGKGKIIPHRHTQLEQSSRTARKENYNFKKSSSFLNAIGVCKNAFDASAKIVETSYYIIRNSLVTAALVTTLFTIVAASQSPTIEQRLTSSFEKLVP